MSEAIPTLRPIGTEFEDITETPTERTITRLKVIRHVADGYGGQVEVLQILSTETTVKSPPTPSERK